MKTGSSMAAFITIPSVSTRVSKRYSPRVRCSAADTTAADVESSKLIELYTITEPANLNVAAAAAARAWYSLPKFEHRSPVPAHTREAFERAQGWLSSRPHAHNRRLCLDVGCGTAQSSVKLAQHLPPDFDVVAIDRSLPRLSRNHVFRRTNTDDSGKNDDHIHSTTSPQIDNLLLLRADITQFWRLCLMHGVRPQRQFILYPNPYPRPGDIKRRFYAQPTFPMMARLGGVVEIRSSWRAYLEEWRAAQLELCRLNATTLDGQPLPRPGEIEQLTWPSRDVAVTEAMTNFEAKYINVGLPVFRLTIGSEDVST